MKNKLRTHHGLLLITAAAASAISSTVLADNPLYKYKEKDGTVWFTDRPALTQEYDKMDFVGFHGRETATASCRGVTTPILLARARRYEYPIQRFAGHYGIPVPLVQAIISVESCFDELAESRAGAQGLMQLMPTTAAEVSVTDPFDPEQNIRGGIHYFSKMHRRFNADLELALAAYNAGPGAVDRFGGIPPFRETRDYVKKVIAKYQYFFGQSSR